MKEEYQRVYARVNLDRILYNYKSIEEKINPGVKVICVLKTDGYGHGALPIARVLEKRESVFGFALATAEEALIMRKAGIRKPLLILGYTFPYSYEELIKQDIRMTVFQESTIDDLVHACHELEKQGIHKKALVHVKVDTGMSRIGVTPDQKGLQFVKYVSQFNEIELEGVFTHFSKADEKDRSATYKQMDRFHYFLKMLRENKIQIPYQHASNSAGIMEYPETEENIVRAGIILYGLWPSNELDKMHIAIQPVLSLHSSIVYIKEIEKGTAISYGGTFIAEKKMRIATIPVGYGDGYPRMLSNVGYVLIRGKKAPITGRVCMDQFMVDVTDIPDAVKGDLVTLIGQDQEQCITMEELGELSGRFNYELACDLSKRIPRVYTSDDKIVETKDYYQDF